MVLNREEFMNAIEQLSGDNADDATMELIANVTETFDDLSARATADIDSINAEHEKEMKELDDAWRKKYKDAYFHGAEDENEDKKDEVTEEPVTYDALFTQEEEGE